MGFELVYFLNGERILWLLLDFFKSVESGELKFIFVVEILIFILKYWSFFLILSNILFLDRFFIIIFHWILNINLLWCFPDSLVFNYFLLIYSFLCTKKLLLRKSYFFHLNLLLLLLIGILSFILYIKLSFFIRNLIYILMILFRITLRWKLLIILADEIFAIDWWLLFEHVF